MIRLARTWSAYAAAAIGVQPSLVRALSRGLTTQFPIRNLRGLGSGVLLALCASGVSRYRSPGAHEQLGGVEMTIECCEV